MDSVYEKAVENVKNYPGFYFLKPGYQEEPYDPVKVKSYIKEIRSIRIDSLKCSTYREMIEKFQENFAIIDRALFLQNQIARGLMHGYTDPSLDDDTMVELRARAAFFTSVKRALLQTNHKIYENKRAAGATTAQWDREMKNQIPNRFDYVIHTFEGGHAQEVFEKYLADYKEENDTKEHTIKVLHRLHFQIIQIRRFRHRN